jgi:hypothetical protein
MELAQSIIETLNPPNYPSSWSVIQMDIFL